MHALIMKRMPGQTLEQYLEQHPTLSWQARLRLTALLTKAYIEQVANLGLIHRDIKPANIMVERKADSFCIRFIDYGLSCLQSDEKARKKYCGTQFFISPEQLRHEIIDPSSDMFSMGCVLLSVWKAKKTEYAPELKQLRLRLLKDRKEGKIKAYHLFSSLSDSIPEALKNSLNVLIHQMLIPEVAKRLSWYDAVKQINYLVKTHLPKRTITPLEKPSLKQLIQSGINLYKAKRTAHSYKTINESYINFLIDNPSPTVSELISLVKKQTSFRKCFSHDSFICCVLEEARKANCLDYFSEALPDIDLTKISPTLTHPSQAPTFFSPDMTDLASESRSQLARAIFDSSKKSALSV